MVLKSEADLFPAHVLIKYLDASHIKRLFVVGDLHGCYLEFMQQLKKIEFDFKKDLIISVGDLVDRGQDSLKCLELIKEPWFEAIRGNHEQMCLEAQLVPEMVDFHCKHGGAWLYQLPIDKKLECINSCLSLPIVLEVAFNGKVYGFVHADIDLNNWQDFKKSIYRNDYFTSENSSALQKALWGRGRISYAPKNKKFKNVIGIDEIYLGHTVVEEARQIHNCFYVDTGVVFGKRLTIKELS
ncbi:metallophosphoesterase [Acinetobacter sp. PK01]|uniref:metallophosphoesterase n=1 Tax=Acinetobacter sp. PK01 TaxID=2930198 RepID=UPI001FB56F54|nr:metallophosphoesterase [Acinetobacter sp. PK01]UOG18336.1 metallophosphoesterase [Acinetobacter sp. PK01]